MGFGIIKGTVKGTKAVATGGWKMLGGLGSHTRGLLAALSLGLFGGNSQQQQALQQVPARQESRQDFNYPDVDMGEQDEPGHTIHRSR